jgi:pimeloyl-ACP methyl ester carboxylesterase
MNSANTGVSKVPPEATVLTTEGTLLEYVDVGKGIPLIMLHGGTGSIEEWGDCVDFFAETYRVIAYNRRGYGRSTPRYVFSSRFFEEDVDDLAALIEALGLDGPVFLCGFSDGGTIALMFAVRYPTRVRAMVCSGGHIYVDRKTTAGLEKARKAFENRVKRHGVEDTPQTGSQRAWFDLWLHPGFEPFSIEDKIRRIQCPTLVIQGMEDEYAEPSHAQRIAQGIKDSKLWLVKGARHWVHGGKEAQSFKKVVLGYLADK